MFPRYLADIAPPMGQTRDFNYCIRLDNLTDYPNYLIVAKISSRSERQQQYPSDSMIVLNPGTCLLTGNVVDRPQITLFAVPRSKVSPDDLFKLEARGSGQLRIVDPEGNLVGIVDRQHNPQYFDPKAQEQAQQRNPMDSIFQEREGDRVLLIEHSGTVLKSPKVLASNGIPAKVLASNGIPASPIIHAPTVASFWYTGRTIEGHYTISTLTDQTFTIKESQRDTNDTNWIGLHLLVLPLLGVILLVMVKWYHQRSQLNPSNKYSKTLNNP